MKKFFFNLIVKMTAVATIASSFVAFTPARAATITSVSDTMTRLKISETATHTVDFTLPTGVNFDVAGGEDAFAVAFSGFTFSDEATFVIDDFEVWVEKSSVLTELPINAVTTAEGTACSGAGANEVGIYLIDGETYFTVKACDDTSFEASDTAGDIRIIVYGGSGTGAGTITNPATTGSRQVSVTMDDEGSPSAHNGSTYVSIMDDDQVSVSATVASTVTFDIDVAASHGDSDDPYSVSLGTLSTSDVTVSGTTDSINHIYLDIDSNSTNGIDVTVQNTNGANGLVSTSNSSNNINSTEGAMSAGTERYGLCVSSVAASSGTLSKAGDYATGTCASDSNTNDNEDLTTTAAPIVSSSGPIGGGNAEITVQAAISALTVAASDYSDVLTFIATATF